MSNPYQYYYPGQPPQHYYQQQFPQYGDLPQYQQPGPGPQLEVVIPTRSQHPNYPLQAQPQVPAQYHPVYEPNPEPVYQPHYDYNNFQFEQMPQIQQPPQIPQYSVQPSPRILQDVNPNGPRQQVMEHLVEPATKRESVNVEVEEPDWVVLLLTMADEYFDTAAKLNRSDDEYFKLIATALGCLESVLENFKLPPMREAQISLKYAQVLYDETENNDDAERVLTKAIDLCERNKFLDLKYAMQLLQSRILYRSRPKAAVKDIQAVIEDVKAYRHIAWEYALRFQYVQFALSSTSVYDLHVATSQVEKIANMARHHGDNAVFAFASVFEASLHLRTSSIEAVPSAQRALAKARALQLNIDVSGNPQLMIMMEFIDLCCSIREFNLAQYDQKRKNMQQVLYQSLENYSWPDNTFVKIPVSKRSLNGQQIQEGGLMMEKNEKFYLTFQWMTKEEAETLGYLLSAVSTAHKNASDGGKAEKFIDTGLDIIRTTYTVKISNHSDDAQGQAARRKIIECHLLLETSFLKCAKGMWTSANEILQTIDDIRLNLGDMFPPSMVTITQYLRGVVQQGTGNLAAALEIFQSPVLKLTAPDATSTKAASKSHARIQDLESETIRNTSILATMNAALIVHNPTHPQHNLLPSFLAALDPIAQASQNKNIQASYSFLRSVILDNTILKAKQYLGSALSTAQQISNAQITALTLVLMQEKFFKGVVGDQAVKCSKAASHQVKRWSDPMWAHVAAKMEADCFELQGMKEESQKKRMEAESRLALLPEKVQKRFQS